VPFDLLENEDEDNLSSVAGTADAVTSDDASSLRSDVKIVIGGMIFEEDTTEVSLLFEQMRSAVDQLFSLALQIRHPSTRKVPAIHKVDLYKHLAPDFKDQFIKEKEETEYEGLVQMFQQWRKEMQNIGEDDPFDSMEPLTEEDELLVRRLLKANHVRRCRFQYWKQYKSKSRQFTLKDADGLPVHWPTAPIDAAPKAMDFECPYCFFLCPPCTAKGEAWRYSS
jgi:hypothetical protein